MTLGEYIKYKRKTNKLTQQELADKLNISDKTISKWENDICEPDIENIKRLSIILNTSIFELINHRDINNYTRKDLDKLKSYNEINKNKIVNYLMIIILIISLYFNITSFINKTSTIYIIDNKNINGYIIFGNDNYLHINSIVINQDINDIKSYKIDIIQDKEIIYSYANDNNLIEYLNTINLDIKTPNRSKNLKIVIYFETNKENKIIYDIILKKR